MPSGEPPSRLAGPALSPSSSTEGGDSPNNKQTFSPDSDTASVSSSLRRPHRPPNLDLSSFNLTPISHLDITIHTSSHPPPPLPDDKKGAELTEQAPPTTDINEASNRKGRETSVLSSATDLDPTRSSTPLTAKMCFGKSIPCSCLTEALYVIYVRIQLRFVFHFLQWNSSNLDTNETEESVRISEVSLFQEFNCMQELLLGKEKVSLLERCPRFRGVLREQLYTLL